MRVVNENFESITEYDLEKGCLVPATAIREDAEPINHVTKHAWADEDYEDVLMYVQATEPESAPTAQEDTDAMMVDHEYRLTLLELGLTE